MRKFLKWFGIAALMIAVAAVLALTVFTSKLKSEAKSRIQTYLQQRFQSDVRFTDFDVSLYPMPGATIDGLALYHKGRTDLPPLIRIRRVTLRTGIFGLFERHIRIRSVQLEGLVITFPPKNSGARPEIHASQVDLAKKYPVLIDEIDADNAMISIMRSDTNKPPRDFPIQHLHIQDFSFDGPARFQAQLTNAVPTGEIDASGEFGPWIPDEPREMPVSAHYAFKNADMGTLRGLSGTLQSIGVFSGPLDYLNVIGTTDVPNFALRISTHPVALHTDFTAIVDGTNGNVILKPVVARFRHTTFVVNGEVVDLSKTEKGRTILLDVVSKEARIEDLLFLTVKNDPPIMTGDTHFTGKMEIREGEEDLLQKLSVNGVFDVAQSHFTSPNVQEKIDSLSRRGQGHPGDNLIDDVVSDLKGNFVLTHGVINFSDLDFSVIGATVDLHGNYGMESGALDFHGHLLLQAKLSQTMTGAKSFFLKAADPFFKGKNGGSSVPIKITGTKDHPQYGLDLGGGKKK
ncbi:MAG: hypothetical protein WB985_02740 [Candidatus Acidiferrales bacterium]